MSIDKFMIENAEVISALSFIPQSVSIHPDFVDKRWITLNSEVEKRAKEVWREFYYDVNLEHQGLPNYLFPNLFYRVIKWWLNKESVNVTVIEFIEPYFGEAKPNHYRLDQGGYPCKMLYVH